MLYRNLSEKFLQTALNKTVNDIMSLLFINQLGMQFCMKGRNPLKISFESCFPSIMNLVFGKWHYLCCESRALLTT